MFRSFNAHGVNTCRFSILAHLIEKHGFAYAAQTNQKNTFGRPCLPEPLQTDGNVLPDFISPRKFWRWTTGTGGKRILYWIHVYRV